MTHGIWVTMRPIHWIKNFFVFVPLFFSGGATDPMKLGRVFLVFVSFSAMASAVYFLNDIVDRKRDLSHPQKCLRPIASGVLPVQNRIFFWFGAVNIFFSPCLFNGPDTGAPAPPLRRAQRHVQLLV